MADYRNKTTKELQALILHHTNLMAEIYLAMDKGLMEPDVKTLRRLMENVHRSERAYRNMQCVLAYRIMDESVTEAQALSNPYGRKKTDG